MAAPNGMNSSRSSYASVVKGNAEKKRLPRVGGSADPRSELLLQILNNWRGYGR